MNASTNTTTTTDSMKQYNDLFAGHTKDNNVCQFDVKDGVEWKDIDAYFRRECLSGLSTDDPHWKWRGWGFESDDSGKNRQVTLVLVGCAHWMCECTTGKRSRSGAYNNKALMNYLAICP